MARPRAGLKRPTKNDKSSPRKKKAKVSSDSDYEYEESSPSSSDDDDNDDEDYDEEDEESNNGKPKATKSKATKSTKSVQPTSTKSMQPTSTTSNHQDPATATPLFSTFEEPPPRKKLRVYKKKKKSFDLSKDEGLTTDERKTSKGGYAHTELSRSRISKANSGNIPWNKGKTRSSATIAKIAAGVRARNRALLLEKLKRLGMTEEEYLVKKKEIKTLREKVRKAKRMNEKHKLADMELKLKAALDATNEEKRKEEAAKASKQAAINKRNEQFQREQKVVKDKAFTRAVIWTPFSFVEIEGGNNDGGGDKNTNDNDNSNENEDDQKQQQQQQQQESYEEVCPNRGPGGLICCEICSNKYSSFLIETVRDMEVQKTHKCGKEIQEIASFLQDGRDALKLAMGVARKKVPPLPPRRPMPSPPAAAAALAAATTFPGRESSSPLQGTTNQKEMASPPPALGTNRSQSPS